MNTPTTLVHPTDDEIEVWVDGFLTKATYNRPVAMQIAMQAAKWVRGQSAAPTPASQSDLQKAHELGFLRCAGWAQRDDLFADISSPTYRKDRDHDLATIAAPPAQAEQASPTDAERYAYLIKSLGPYQIITMATDWFIRNSRSNTPSTKESVDAAIDAAIAASKGRDK